MTTCRVEGCTESAEFLDISYPEVCWNHALRLRAADEGPSRGIWSARLLAGASIPATAGGRR